MPAAIVAAEIRNPLRVTFDDAESDERWLRSGSNIFSRRRSGNGGVALAVKPIRNRVIGRSGHRIIGSSEAKHIAACPLFSLPYCSDDPMSRLSVDPIFLCFRGEGSTQFSSTT